MPRCATVAASATRTAGDAGSGTLAWLNGELDRAWVSGDAPRARLLAHLIDDVQRQAEERRPAAARNLPLRAPMPQPSPPWG